MQLASTSARGLQAFFNKISPPPAIQEAGKKLAVPLLIYRSGLDAA
jgi:hypothetical protein